MKAVRAKKYGDPEVLYIANVEKPSPKEDQILIKVHYSTVTPTDAAMRSGKPFIVRFFSGLTKPNNIFGSDFAGVVESVGEKVTKFNVGDEVYGMSADAGGGNAEYLCLKESKVIGAKPRNITYAEAASITDGGLTALVFLRDIAKIKKGQSILINGATGNVGSAAVQLAKYYGAIVTAVCSKENSEFVKSIGADKVINYEVEDFLNNGEKYDFIFDVVGKSTFGEAKKSLTEKGMFLATVPTFGVAFATLRTMILGNKKAAFAATGLMQTPANLEYMTKLIESGDFKPIIDSEFEMKDVDKAHELIDKKHRRGNVVLKIGD